MDDGTRLTTVADVDDSYLFTVSGPSGLEEEVFLARTDAGETDDEADGDAAGGGGTDDGTTDDQPVRAWKNFCMHEPDQPFHRGEGVGVALRDGQVICPRHGSMFDLDTGGCDNGPAAGQRMVEVDVAVDNGVVYLTDDNLTFEHEGGLDDDDGMPSSTSHLGL